MTTMVCRHRYTSALGNLAQRDDISTRTLLVTFASNGSASSQARGITSKSFCGRPVITFPFTPYRTPWQEQSQLLALFNLSDCALPYALSQNTMWTCLLASTTVETGKPSIVKLGRLTLHLVKVLVFTLTTQKLEIMNKLLLIVIGLALASCTNTPPRGDDPVRRDSIEDPIHPVDTGSQRLNPDSVADTSGVRF